MNLRSLNIFGDFNHFLVVEDNKYNKTNRRCVFCGKSTSTRSRGCIHRGIMKGLHAKCATIH